MIKDKTTQGYKIAEKCAQLYKTESKEAAAKYYEENASNQVLWVQLAIKDTFQHLIKEGN